tara:strand:- start:579 stop:1376 length:798 start_codon:yes stop_codon:yes gene_type:complete
MVTEGKYWINISDEEIQDINISTEFVSGYQAGFLQVHTGNIIITNKRIRFEANNSAFPNFNIVHTDVVGAEGNNSSTFGGQTYLKFVTKNNEEYKFVGIKNGKDISDFLNFEFYTENIQNAKHSELNARTINDYKNAINLWENIGKTEHVTRIWKIIKSKIDIAKRHEKLLEFDEAASMYKELGMDDATIRVRELKSEKNAVKVTQKVVHGDEITKTEIKDSVLNRSNVGSGRSKIEELKDLAEMKKEGLISENDYEKMKLEIIG